MNRPPADDEPLQSALQQLGARRVEATLVASLVDAGPMGTRDIVERTGLRQPEVSVGMQELRDRNWIASEPVPRAGKGRPMHRYKLTIALGQIRRHYEDQGRRTLEQFNVAMKVLRDRLG